MSIVLGIESTAHTFGIGVFNDKKLGRKRLVHSRDVYRPTGEGIVPRKVADHHEHVFLPVLKDALAQAGIGLDDVDAIAFSQGPGIGQPLQFGCAMARYISAKTGAVLVPVNHCAAHIEIGMYDAKMKDPLVVYVSGGNTQLIVKDKMYRVMGETLDIGMGNLFDVFAMEIGLEYGHGSELELLAQKHKNYIAQTPYTVKGMNVAFGGLLTYAKKHIGKYSREDIAYSVMHNAFAMETEAAERALCLTKKKELLVCGGVAQNTMFRNMLKTMLVQHKAKLGVPRNEYNADNGAMIAYTGYSLYKKHGKKATVPIEKAVPNPRWRIDQVKYL